MASEEMHLYHLSLQAPTAIRRAIGGSFSAAGEHEIVAARGTMIELLRFTESGEIQSIASVNTFSIVRSLLPFRLTGTSRDHVVVGSDSGRITVLEFDPAKNTFVQVIEETYGKTGCRRAVPGEYLAADPHGRALLIGAVEKQKFVYGMSRDNRNDMVISSPLEAHRSHTILYDVVGVDMNTANPMFACLELSYEAADADPTGAAAAETDQFLTFYELDLGLNNVIRKFATSVDRGANRLISVPAWNDLRGGVIVCSDNVVSYHQTHDTERNGRIKTLLPRRDGTENEGLMIISSAVHKTSDFLVILAQTEYGDLYRFILEKDAEGNVCNLLVRYFDTIPPATSLCITKHGFLFAASEAGDHGVYMFNSTGDDPHPADTRCLPENLDELTEAEIEDVTTALVFTPQPMTNLSHRSALQSVAPVVGALASDVVGERTAQLYTLSGRAHRSSLRTLRYGLAVSDLLASDLGGGRPDAVWTLRRAPGDAADAYLVISFPASTQFFTIGDSIDRLEETGTFEADKPTLCLQLLDTGGLVQVVPDGMLFFPTASPTAVARRWAKDQVKIDAAAANPNQVLLALSDSTVAYFAVGPEGRFDKVTIAPLEAKVTAIAVGDIPESRRYASFAAVATSDKRVRLLALDGPDPVSRSLAVFSVDDDVHSLALFTVQHAATAGAAAAGAGAGGDVHATGASGSATYLVVGLANGVTQRHEIDAGAGTVGKPRAMNAGVEPVRLCKTHAGPQRGLAVLSSNPWLSYTHGGSLTTSRLSTEPIRGIASFSTPDLQGAYAAVGAFGLRIFTIDDLGQAFNQRVEATGYTPRRVVRIPASPFLVVAETDHNALGRAARANLRAAEAEAEALEAARAAGQDDAAAQAAAAEAGRVAAAAEPSAADVAASGVPKPGEEGRWAGCLRVVDARSGVTAHALEVEGEAVLSLATCVFHDRGGELFVVVGTAKDMRLRPTRCSEGYLSVYRLMPTETGLRLHFLHKTRVDGAPTALCEFQGMLLVGLGSTLRLYDMGKRKLLCKCGRRGFPTTIVDIKTVPKSFRVFVSDANEAVHVVRYREEEKQLIPFADCVTPRFMTASTLLDAGTVAGADKFGNVFISRLPETASDDAAAVDATQVLWEESTLGSSMAKMKDVVQFHIGEVVTSLQKVTFSAGSKEVILYITINGQIGVFFPFASKERIDFFTRLELAMRSEFESLTGRGHMSFRGAFIPCKAVVDGDLCEMFDSLSPAKREAVSDHMKTPQADIRKRLDDVRNEVM